MPPHLLANAHTRTHTLPDVFQRASTSSLVEQVPMQAAALANHLKYARGIAVPPDPVALHELKLFRWRCVPMRVRGTLGQTAVEMLDQGIINME
uniref:LysR_substrate domain-containing protein n=1 Tax=Mesocestoides corti TaxID=53468 RepID=A0A5K3EVW4_MESCO